MERWSAEEEITLMVEYPKIGTRCREMLTRRSRTAIKKKANELGICATFNVKRHLKSPNETSRAAPVGLNALHRQGVSTWDQQITAPPSDCTAVVTLQKREEPSNGHYAQIPGDGQQNGRRVAV